MNSPRTRRPPVLSYISLAASEYVLRPSGQMKLPLSKVMVSDATPAAWAMWGFIASAAALLGVALAPTLRDYLFFSHLSTERGHRVVLERLKARPLLTLEMRLGEGTGAAAAMGLIDAAIRLYREMATFDSAAVSDKAEE